MYTHTIFIYLHTYIFTSIFHIYVPEICTQVHKYTDSVHVYLCTYVFHM